MPWFPEITSGLELARQARAQAAQADPVAAYIRAVESGNTEGVERAWPAEVAAHDPRAGRIASHQQFNQFVTDSAAWLAERQAHAEPVATTSAAGRVVVELLAQLVQDGRSIAWPLAVVAEPSPDGRAVTFRSYYSQWPLTGRHQRDPILAAGGDHPDDVVADYQAALAAGDADAAVAAFEPDGSFREPSGPQHRHRGTDQLREFFTMFFSAGGGIGLQHCTVADDGTGCALEYNCVAGAGSPFPRRPALRSTSADHSGGWRPPASTTTSRHPSKTTELIPDASSAALSWRLPTASEDCATVDAPSACSARSRDERTGPTHSSQWRSWTWYLMLTMLRGGCCAGWPCRAV
jgi:SnoaL-like domain